MTHMSIHVSIEYRVLNTAGFLICMNFCINDTCQAVCCDKKPTYMRKDSKGFLSIYAWQSECEVLLNFYSFMHS